MDKFDPVGDLERETWNRVMATNLTVPMMVTKRAVNLMLEAKLEGSIVNVSAVAGFRGFIAGNITPPNDSSLDSVTRDFSNRNQSRVVTRGNGHSDSIHCASKHGLMGLTKNTAAYYGSKGI